MAVRKKTKKLPSLDTGTDFFGGSQHSPAQIENKGRRDSTPLNSKIVAGSQHFICGTTQHPRVEKPRNISISTLNTSSSAKLGIEDERLLPKRKVTLCKDASIFPGSTLF